MEASGRDMGGSSEAHQAGELTAQRSEGQHQHFHHQELSGARPESDS